MHSLQEQDKDAHSRHFYSTYFWKSQPQQSKKKNKKRKPTWKRRSTTVTADDMILYIENHKGTTRILEFINKFNKVAGQKINIQKSVEFLYTNYKISERKIKETIPFTTALKRIKF